MANGLGGGSGWTEGAIEVTVDAALRIRWLGYPLHLRAATTRVSSTRWTVEEDRDLARLNKVLITETLCAMGWWEEKDRYLSVWVGFLNTEVEIVPSSS